MNSWESIEYFLEIKYFQPDSFSESPEHCKHDVIYNLDAIREVSGQKIYPSRIKGALARFERSTSKHSAIDKKSSAINFFMEGIPIINFFYLLSSGFYGGIGIYLNTTGVDGKPWVMFHTDLREFNGIPLIWFCTKDNKKNKYHYPLTNKSKLKYFLSPNLYKNKTYNHGGMEEK